MESSIHSCFTRVCQLVCAFSFVFPSLLMFTAIAAVGTDTDTVIDAVDTPTVIASLDTDNEIASVDPDTVIPCVKTDNFHLCSCSC